VGLVVGAEEDGIVAQGSQQVFAAEEGLAQPLQPIVLAASLPAVEGLEVVVPGRAVVQPQAAGGEELDELEFLDAVGVDVLDLVEGLQLGLGQRGTLVLDRATGKPLTKSKRSSRCRSRSSKTNSWVKVNRLRAGSSKSISVRLRSHFSASL
jgi:hypothetical protein